MYLLAEYIFNFTPKKKSLEIREERREERKEGRKEKKSE